MILIEVEGGTHRRFHLEFHPRLTVVAGLARAQRHELIALLTTAIHGGAVPAIINADVAGVPQPLTPSVVGALGLMQQPVDLLLQAADLPGAVRRRPAPPPTAPEPPRTAPRAADTKLLLDAAQQRLHELVQQRDALREKLMAPPAPAAVDDLNVVERRRIEEQLMDAQEQLEAFHRHEPPDALEARLRSLHRTINARLEELSADVDQPIVDSLDVQQAFMAYEQHRVQQQQGSVDVDWLVLANDLRTVEEAIADSDEAMTAPTWLIEQLRGELEVAMDELDLAEKEGANEATLGALRRQADDARAAWDEVQAVSTDRVSELSAQREHIRTMAAASMEVEPEAVTPEDLERMHLAVTQAHAQPVQRLREALAAAGVALGPDEDPGPVADRWLDQYGAGMEERTAQQATLQQAALDLADVERQLDGVPALRDAYAQELHYRQTAVRDAQTALARYEQSLEHHQQSQVVQRQAIEAELHALEAEITSGAVDLQQLRMLVAPEPAANNNGNSPGDAISALAGDDKPTDGTIPWWETLTQLGARTTPLHFGDVDVSRVDPQQVEYELITRGVALRRKNFGESIPLIIDAAFDQLDIDDALRLLNALPKMTSVLQVIYLASNDVAETWALRQDERVAAVVEVERY